MAVFLTNFCYTYQFLIHVPIRSKAVPYRSDNVKKIFVLNEIQFFIKIAS
jgi:hypothetical protein